MTDETPDKTPAELAVEHALEVFVYAPIGLLFDGANVIPQLVEKGRSQVTMAKMIGQFAVTTGQGEATKLVDRLQDQAITILNRLGGAHTPEEPITPSVLQDASALATGGSVVAAAPEPAPGPPPPSGPAVDTLAIPDYDGLSASHVVNRLAGLSAAELEAVRAYEAANRGRKTILSKIAQLQAG
jgi:hypothetical protein